MTFTVGVDVGGTKIAAAVVTPAGEVVARASQATPTHEADATVAAICVVVESLVADHEAIAVGLSVAAFVDRDRRRVVFSPNLPWRDVPLPELVSKQVGLPVVLENDGNAAAWGEVRHGAAVGAADVLAVTVGTGVGGGLVLGGQLHRGGHGMAGEIGHLRIVPDGRACGCGRSGCLEQYASGSALVAACRAAAAAGRASDLLDRAGGSVERIDGALVTAAAQAGDAFSVARLAELGDWLGQGIASLIAVTDPETVVIGGGVVAAGDLLLDPVRRAVAAHLPGQDRPTPRIVPAALGNDAGFIGAADLARSDG